jgi:hypothetical protein
MLVEALAWHHIEDEEARWRVAPVHLRRVCQTLAASDGAHPEARGYIPVDRVGR